MEKTDKLKNHLRSNIYFYAVIAILGVMWGIERMNGRNAHRELKKHYEQEFKKKDDIIIQNKWFIDSITSTSKKKDFIIDSLGGVKSESRTRVIYIEKKSDEKVDIIRSADRDTSRLLFTGYTSR